MSLRTPTPGLAADLRAFDYRLRRLESGAVLNGTVSIGSLRIGDFIVEQVGTDLRARSLVAPFTTAILIAGP